MKMMLMPAEELSNSLNPSILEVNYTLQLLSLKRNPVMCSLKLSLLSITFTWHFLPLFFFPFSIYYKIWVILCIVETTIGHLCFLVQLLLYSLPADVLRGSSHVPSILNSSRINDILQSGYDLHFI